jgi:hypothetical protein
MSDLHKALGDISSIRRQMAESTEFRGYGPATLAVTAVFALLASQVQAALLPDPAAHLGRYLGLWIATALLAAALTAVQMVTRTRRMHSGLSNEMLGMAVEQFLPALGAGFLLMVVLARCAPESVWLLPALWQIVFSLGVFSSCRFLPRAMHAAGAWYLLTGLACIGVGKVHPLSPWLMAVPFGVGQLLVAGILYFARLGVTHED